MRKTLSLMTVLATAGCYQVEPAPTPTPMMMPAPETKTPTINSFTADKTSVLTGQQVTLSYSVDEAESVKIDQVGGGTLLPASPALGGTVFTPPLTANTSFILTAVNKDKQAAMTLSIIVTTMPMESPHHASISAFGATPTAITAGMPSMLSWNTSQATSGVIRAPDGTLVLQIATSELASGSFAVSPGDTTVYELAVKGSDDQEVTLTRAVTVTQVGSGMLTARQIFDQNVLPIMTARCASCHADPAVNGPDYLGTTGPSGYYSSMVQYTSGLFMTRPENNLLLLKGAHTGPAFTSNEKNTVQAWILAEVDERGIAPPPPPPMDYHPRTLAEALTRFGACMQRSVWDNTYGQNPVAEQDTIGANGNGQGGGPCYSCHATGTAGSFLNQSSGDTFDMNRLQPYVLKLVNGTVHMDGTFGDLVPAHRWRDKGQDPGHPSYLLTAARNQGIDSFMTQTLTRYHDFTQNCTP